MKLYEKIILNRIKLFLDRNKILIKQQSGFRFKRKTKDNLIFMTQKIQEAFGKKMKVCCVFFDIQAAFDKVWHQGLIYKLCKLKFPLYLIDWVWNFLTERRFRVLVGDYHTEYFDITCGTPQGAVTSPTLFSIYINDIPLDGMKNDS